MNASREPGRNHFQTELFANLINFLINYSSYLSLIFIPLLATDLGAGDFGVGVAVSAYGAAFLVSSLIFGRRSDLLGRVAFVRWGCLLVSFAFLSQILAGNIYLLVLFRSFVGFSLGVVSAALLAYVYEAVGHVGKFSSYGSLGWIFASLTAGVIKEYNLLFSSSAGLCLLAFALAWRLKEPGKARGAGKKEEAAVPPLLPVLRRNFRIYLAIFLRHLGAQSVWAILPLYFVWLGADKLLVGVLAGINFTVQFFAMRYVERFSAWKVFTAGQVVSIFVFLAYAAATHYSQLFIVQAVLGVSWSCLYVGALLIVMNSGEEKGTAGGIFQSTLNLCAALGPFFGGIIAHSYGYRGVMFFAASVGVAGLFTTLPGARKVSREAA